jgi:hypothetical protein
MKLPLQSMVAASYEPCIRFSPVTPGYRRGVSFIVPFFVASGADVSVSCLIASCRAAAPLGCH